MGDSIKAVHLLLGNYEVDSRVRNQTESLSTLWDISVFCYASTAGNSNGSLCETSDVEGVSIHRFNKKGGIFGVVRVFIAMIFMINRLKPDIVHCHDAVSLPLGYILSKVGRSKIIYDSHELWSQAHHKPRSQFVIRGFEFLERVLAHRADHILTVSRGISLYLMGYFQNSRISVVRNTPTYMSINENSAPTRSFLRKKIGLQESDIVVIYQGLVKRERGVFLLLDAMGMVEDKAVKLIIVGDGPDLKEFQSAVRDKLLSDRVLLVGHVPQNELVNYTRIADFGVHAISNTCLNHDLCLPNKLFEYLSAGIPVVVTNLSEMGNYVLTNGFGFVFADGNADSLAKVLDDAAVEETLSSKRVCVESHKESYSWDSDFIVLQRAYREVVGR